MSIKCKACWFFRRIDKVRDRGFCHRQPPAAMPADAAEFPNIQEDDWGGEWQPKAETEETGSGTNELKQRAASDRLGHQCL